MEVDNLTEKEIETEKEFKPKCPKCGSEELDIPDNVEKKDGCFFIKGTNLQLHTLPMIAYICTKCGRKVTSDEVMRAIGHI